MLAQTVRSVRLAARAGSDSPDAASSDDDATIEADAVDGVDPTITGAASPEANGKGWYRDDVRVTWECADGESGVVACEPPLTLRDETPEGRVVTGTARDAFGNTAQAQVCDDPVSTGPPNPVPP